MEASIVLPMIILVIITVVLIIVFFYTQIAHQSRMHIALRGMAGAMTGKTVYLNEQHWSGSVHNETKTFGGYVYGKEYLVMRDKGILNAKATRVIEGSYYSIDAPKYVRYCNMIKGSILDEE